MSNDPSKIKPPVTIKPGVVFWPKTDQKDIHPWIIISQPVDGLVLLTNFTDAKNNPEEECVFQPGWHGCLTIPSILYFSDKSVQRADNMAKVIWEGKMVTHYHDLTPDLLALVLREARVTVDMTERVKKKYGIIKPPAVTTAPF